MFQFSLKKLLAATVFMAVCCAALKYASPAWWLILSGLSLLAFMALAVMAVVGVGQQQGFARGFVICVLIYGAVLFLSGLQELDPYVGRLPTTKALLPVYQFIQSGNYVDLMTGQPVPPPTNSRTSFNGGMLGGGGMGGGMGGMIGYLEQPDRKDFMTIGHLLWADLLGLIGGLFAGFIVRRSAARSAEPAPSSTGQDATE
jgi:hypothetical protein